MRTSRASDGQARSRLRLIFAALSAVAIALPLTSSGVAPSSAAGEASVSVSGTVVMNRDGSPSPAIFLRLRPIGSTSSPYMVYSKADGTFSIPNVVPGEYTLCNEGSSGGRFVVPTCWGDTDRALPVVVGAEAVTGITVRIAERPIIQGTLVVNIDGALVPYSDADVSYAPEELATNWVHNRSWYAMDIESDGTFRSQGLIPGAYVIRMSPRVWGSPYKESYYDDAPFIAAARSLTVGGDEVLDLGMVELTPEGIDVSRVAGVNRYETATLISQKAFPDPVVESPVVYVTNGLKFPDSLAAGPAVSAEGGVLLTVPPGELPAVVGAELARLHPDEVVVVGDEASVSATVHDAIAAIVGEDRVTRIGGANRYETARMLVRRAFTTVSHLYIATGRNYPDALSAGPVAAQRRSAVLLVDGGAATLTPETVQLIDDLAPSTINIIGGLASVSAGVESGVEQWAASSPGTQVNRLAGENRYETSTLVSATAQWPREAIIVAVGTGFADALAAAPLAARWKAPVYLTPANCLYVGAAVQIDQEANVQAVIGGESTLSQAVEQRVRCPS